MKPFVKGILIFDIVAIIFAAIVMSTAGVDISKYAGGIVVILLVFVVVMVILYSVGTKSEERKRKDKTIIKTRLVTSDVRMSRTGGIGVNVGAGISVGGARTYHQNEHTFQVFYKDGHVEIEKVSSGTTRDVILMNKLEA